MTVFIDSDGFHIQPLSEREPGKRVLPYKESKRAELKELLFNVIRHKAGKQAESQEKQALLEKFCAKATIDYLTSYLIFNNDTGHDVGTICIEWSFLSLSFLSDYSNYYSSMYENLEKKCIRIHFFDRVYWSEEEFCSLLKGQDDLIRDKYLGYVVFKPLDNSIVGASVLRPYGDKPNRYFNAVRTYKVDLLGYQFRFDSLAFQEQDNAVSVCATTALWMTFSKTSKLFRTELPSPYDITMAAGIRKDIGRMMPNDGLDLNQIIRSIHSLGLDAEVRGGNSLVWVAGREGELKVMATERLRRIIYAYLRCRIPILFGYFLTDSFDSHMVTVTGYRLEPIVRDEQSKKMRLVADSIIKLYAHDDQLGPFSKIELDDEAEIPLKVKVLFENDFSAFGTEMVIPIKKSIRIKFEEIEAHVGCIHSFFVDVFSLLPEPKEVKWDIYLTRTRDYKVSIWDEEMGPMADDKKKLEIVSGSYPFYIWVAKMILNGGEVLHLVFDSTTIRDNLMIYQVFFVSPTFHQWVQEQGIFPEEGRMKARFLRYTEANYSDWKLFRKASSGSTGS
ncbi:MAG TPA: hypothetical protein ENJ82_14005 [Bacteroidetes bacterium]|nr:hypothetical protein [Bacteroidota bacterium]